MVPSVSVLVPPNLGAIALEIETDGAACLKFLPNKLSNHLATSLFYFQAEELCGMSGFQSLPIFFNCHQAAADSKKG